jgi:hypothetical protein
MAGTLMTRLINYPNLNRRPRIIGQTLMPFPMQISSDKSLLQGLDRFRTEERALALDGRVKVPSISVQGLPKRRIPHSRYDSRYEDIWTLSGP